MKSAVPVAYIQTIGCQMNVYDSQRLGAILDSCGYKTVFGQDGVDPSKADLILCNTCSIRHKAEEKAFSFLGQFAGLKQQNPHLITVMAGCVAQQEGEKAFSRLPHLDLVLGTQAFSRFAEHIDSLKSGTHRICDTESCADIFETIPGSNKNSEARQSISEFVTIMQGCNNFCTYCVVPYVRGREKSRSAEAIVKEVESLVHRGVVEVTLLGQNVNSYGGGDDGKKFPELLARINEVPGIKRIRFATSHPKDISDELISAIGRLDKVCKHVHLPVQAGSDRILRKMNRGYTRVLYLSRIKALREVLPDIGLSTDLIVGFPSETQEDFQQTLDLISEVQFHSVFAFSYSKRSFAPASKFSEQVEESEKKRRLNQLLELQDKISWNRNQETIGKLVDVLVERESPKQHQGFGARFPGQVQMSGRTQANQVVHFPLPATTAGISAVGQIVHLRIQDAYAHSLWGIPLSQEELQML